MPVHWLKGHHHYTTVDSLRGVVIYSPVSMTPRSLVVHFFKKLSEYQHTKTKVVINGADATVYVWIFLQLYTFVICDWVSFNPNPPDGGA